MNDPTIADEHRHLTVSERFGGTVVDLGIPLAGEIWQQITITVEQAEHLSERLRGAAAAMRNFELTRRVR